ncbi:MAG: enoyl-CoA hydratase [Gammaproteobacteria bacterium]|nr:enoyl-CoA hydratase [Gammaproteobacteria bacterium]
MTDHILVSQADGVCELRLNRPEKRNAITFAMYDTLWDAVVRAEADDSVRAILLSGAGASFTAGNDLTDFVSRPPSGAEHGPVRFIRLLPKIHKVLIAAVHGTTVGIGVTMLLHCDLVLAARSARLSMPFVKLGLVPEAGSSLLLPRLIGHQRAAELLFLGTAIDAATALNLGLVNRVVDDDVLLEEARTLARAVAEQPAGALRATKQLLRSETGVSARIEEELQAFQERLASAEFKSAAQAFLGKGRPG